MSVTTTASLVEGAQREGFNEGIEVAAAFMRARAAKIRTEGAGNVSLMMARIYEDEAAAIDRLKRNT